MMVLSTSFHPNFPFQNTLTVESRRLIFPETNLIPELEGTCKLCVAQDEFLETTPKASSKKNLSLLPYSVLREASASSASPLSLLLGATMLRRFRVESENATGIILCV